MQRAGLEHLFIGIDVGTTSVKAHLRDAGGAPLDSYHGMHPMSRLSPGAAEQRPEDWMQHVNAALSQFALHPRAAEVTAIGITSQVNTHVFCDAELQPLRPALTWQDTRCAAYATDLDACLDSDAKIAALGAPIPIDASHALSRMAFVAETQPKLWDATAHVMLPKDFVIAELTGQVLADPISAVGLVGTDHAYAGAVLDLVSRAREVLPPLSDPLKIAGWMLPEKPFSGVPVAVGTMDAWASMFGLGVASEGDAMYLSGTSDVLGLISRKGVGAAGIIAFPAWNGIGLHAGPTQSGGASLAWLSNLLGRSVQDLGRLAASTDIHAESPIFLPHLEGERAPLWDPYARGVFSGLSSAVGPAQLAACVMEGVGFAGRLAIEALETSGAQRIEVLRHGGGGALSDAWCQIRANATGRSLDRVTASDPGAIGATVLAAVASGARQSLGEAARSLVAVEQRFMPDLAQKQMFDDRFGLFKELYDGVSPVNRSLAGVID